MAATKEDIHTILRQVFVRNMSAEDADQAAERFLDLYYSDDAIDMSDAELEVNTLTSASGIVITTGDLVLTAGNCNADVGNITDVVATNCNATAGNITDVRASNVNVSVATLLTKSVAFTNVTGATCASTNAIEAGWYVIGVSANVASDVAGATSINVGDGSDDDEFCVISAVTAGSKSAWNGTAHQPELFAANTSVVLTAVGGDATFDGNGNVSVHITYMKSTI